MIDPNLSLVPDHARLVLYYHLHDHCHLLLGFWPKEQEEMVVVVVVVEKEEDEGEESGGLLL